MMGFNTLSSGTLLDLAGVGAGTLTLEGPPSLPLLFSGASEASPAPFPYSFPFLG